RREQVTVLSQTPSAFRQFETVDARLQAELALRLVVFGGEALHQPSVRRWADRHGYHTPRLINMYGITETTVHVTHLELAQDDLGGTASRIGRPLPDLRIHVLDPYGQPSPIGVAGEIHVAGAGVTRGYVGRAALTAERFIPDHLSDRPGSRLYRTGDLARWTAGGRLEYLGRADAQVKIRGHRIELGEVEAALGSHPAVLEAVVTLHDTDLVAYAVPAEQAVTADALRAWLAGRLPDYMAPRWFVLLDALPVTAQGKVDRAALPAPSGERPELTQEYVAPLPGPEESLAGVWRRVLGVDRVGRHDNFFDLGGDSIRSIQILGQARELGLGFDLQELFRHPTLAALTRIAGGMPEPDLERLSGGLVHGGRERPGAGETAVRLGGTPGLRPLVLVHPVGGTLFCYLELAGRVGSAFEVLGVQGDVLGSGGGTADLGELAERYARDLTPLLDGRRPVIAGWSAGGVIAHELAVRLERQGVEAHRLVLIDAHQRRDAADTAEAAALDALRADVLRRGSEAVKDALADTGFHDLLATLGIDEATLAGLDGGAVAALMAFWRDMLAGLAGHRPSRFGGAAELLLARDGTSPEATAAEWRALTGSLTVTHVDGGHFELLREPSVAAIAETLRGSAERMGD
ncbi:AMP-binding protein, partial [Nonomuraea sp. NPDC049649]|uniref:AMP-binding protein n=1 Tax=Nonomuraea sp. NPDC049649 TaxID=3155776 RepID=UPI003444E090